MSTMALEMPMNYVEVTEDEMTYIEGGGFVGFYVHLPSRVINMGAAVGGAFVGGVVGWYCKELALTGPWGAGVAGYSIAKKLSRFRVGVNIPGISWSKHIYL